MLSISREVNQKQLKRPPKDASRSFGKALAREDSKTYLLRLFITGATPKSVKAVSNIKKICESMLKGRLELEVIDLYQDPQKARKDQIVAAPTLVKKLPLPLRRVIGDLSDTERVLVGLDLVEKEGDDTGDDI